MFYFGAWDGLGHFIYDDRGSRRYDEPRGLPWCRRDDWAADGGLQPSGKYIHVDGAAALHSKDGWTGLAFWDTTVDRRPASCSVYFAHGDFTFEQMVELARTRFAQRWKRMVFEVSLTEVATPK